MVDSIRIVLVDDHDIVRTGLRSFLEAQGGLFIVGEARDGFQAVQTVQETCPDVVVMDITMPGYGWTGGDPPVDGPLPTCAYPGFDSA
jgi:YesN/AraC family two-component response regulator